MNGKGIFIWADGDKYDGYFKDNTMHGSGTYICNTTLSPYQGRFQHGHIIK